MQVQKKNKEKEIIIQLQYYMTQTVIVKLCFFDSILDLI
jgi:hypothetical protein